MYQNLFIICAYIFRSLLINNSIFFKYKIKLETNRLFLFLAQCPPTAKLTRCAWDLHRRQNLRNRWITVTGNRWYRGFPKRPPTCSITSAVRVRNFCKNKSTNTNYLRVLIIINLTTCTGCVSNEDYQRIFLKNCWVLCTGCPKCLSRKSYGWKLHYRITCEI